MGTQNSREPAGKNDTSPSLPIAQSLSVATMRTGFSAAAGLKVEINDHGRVLTGLHSSSNRAGAMAILPWPKAPSGSSINRKKNRYLILLAGDIWSRRDRKN